MNEVFVQLTPFGIRFTPTSSIFFFLFFLYLRRGSRGVADRISLPDFAFSFFLLPLVSCLLGRRYRIRGDFALKKSRPWKKATLLKLLARESGLFARVSQAKKKLVWNSTTFCNWHPYLSIIFSRLYLLWKVTILLCKEGKNARSWCLQSTLIPK